MIKRSHGLLITAAALVAFAALAAPHPRADIRILAHRQGDLAPQRMQAIVDVGLASVSVLVTWSRRLGY